MMINAFSSIRFGLAQYPPILPANHSPRFSAAKTLKEQISSPPVLEEHDGITVARDDLTPGGTKVRALIKIFERPGVREVVYPSITCGGAQLDRAVAAKATGKKATILVPMRKDLHPRTLQALEAVGASAGDFRDAANGQRILDSRYLKVIQVPHGFYTVVKKRAREYAENAGALYLPPGAHAKETEIALAETARQLEAEQGPFDEVWCAAGSGTLSRALQRGFKNPRTKFHAVEVAMPVDDLGRATVHRYADKKLMQPLSKKPAPFPSDPHYDRKAWAICQQAHGKGKILFWNVLGDL